MDTTKIINKILVRLFFECLRVGDRGRSSTLSILGVLLSMASRDCISAPNLYRKP